MLELSIWMDWFNFDKLPAKKVWEAWANKIYHTDHVTVMKWSGKKGFKFEDKGHESEQLTIVLKGKFKFFVGNEERVLSEWDSVLINSNEEHGGEALTDVEGVDVFFPRRHEEKYN